MKKKNNSNLFTKIVLVLALGALAVTVVGPMVNNNAVADSANALVDEIGNQIADNSNGSTSEIAPEETTAPVALALTEEDASEEVVEEPQEEYVLRHTLGESLGLIMIPEIGITAPVTYGATDESMIQNSVGLVENRNWGEAGMVMLGHSGASDPSVLFVSLHNVETGMVVTLKGTDGSVYTFLVSDIAQVTYDEYVAGNETHPYNAIVFGGDYDLTLVTCIKNAESGQTDRLIVRCSEI